MTGGRIRFYYGGAITGGRGSALTNNGRIEMTNGTVSVPVDGTGTLAFDGYHSAQGYAKIIAPIAATQTVELNPEFLGLNMALADPGDFRALLKIDAPEAPTKHPCPSL